MKYITITADTYEEALRQARLQYGEKLRIHSRKDFYTKGFLGFGKKPVCELTCFTTGPDVPAESDDSKEIRVYEKEAMTPDPDTGIYNHSVTEDPEPQREEPAESVPQIQHVVIKPFDLNDASTMAPDVSSAPSEIEETVPEEDDELCDDEQEVKTGKENSIQASVSAQEEALSHIRELLEMNDFSDEYSEMILSSLRKILNDAAPGIPERKTLELLALDRIIGSINIDVHSQLSMPRYFVIVGPTGIGKTTTIAKIAAVYGTLPEQQDRKKVRIITLDSFRIGAFEQMEAFGNNLGIPVLRANDRRSFEDCLALCADSDLVLVDTIGKSPHDVELDVRLRNLLHVLPNSQTGFYLGINASMKMGDIEMAYSIFKDLELSGAIVTKTDETSTIGNILSVCWNRNLPIIFITDGQKVPSCIHQATNEYIMSLLKGFGDAKSSVNSNMEIKK